jgi:limonene-1,2-epoxide hydrolase
MTAADHVATVRRYHAALNAIDLAIVEALLLPDAEYRSPSVGVIAGRSAILAAMRSYFAEYPDQVAVDDSIEAIAGGRVRCRWHLRATAKSTGQMVARRGIEVLSFDGQGLIRLVEVEDL